MTLKKLINNIYEDIVVDRKLNRRSPSFFDFIRPLVIPQICSLTIYRISNYFHSKKMYIISKTLRNINIILFGLDIQPEAEIAGGCFIGHTVGIVIGPNVSIDKGCLIFQGVTITPGTHPGKELTSKDVLTIGTNVRIYAGAKLIGNLKIGAGAIIGANAVVLESVPDNVTVGGIPAKHISNQ